MRIAQLAPPMEAVPPTRYGGTERVIATLVDSLLEQGHDVTLLASGDSRTAAELVSITPRAARATGTSDASLAVQTALRLVQAHAAAFDVIHSHLDFAA